MAKRTGIRRALARIQVWRGLDLFSLPSNLTRRQRKNFRNVQMDALGVGLAMSVNPFLAVFLTRLGATNFQIGLLSSIPGFAGLLLAMVIGRFLEHRPTVVPWYSAARLIRLGAFALTGVLALVMPRDHAVVAILLLWLIVSVPQALLSISFTVVMNAIAGSKGRYALMSRRWSIIGIVSAAMTLVVGQILDRVPFPLNYQIAFIAFGALGATISFTFASRYDVTVPEPPPHKVAGASLVKRIRAFARLVLHERAFVAITAKRFVYLLGSRIVMPLFVLYYVRELAATDAWISAITTTQKAVLLLGYSFWTRLRDVRGARFVLLSTTLGVALHPAVTAINHHVAWMVVIAGVAGIFQAGLKLVFFDELMKTVPPAQSATFVAIDKSMVHLLTIVGPLIGTTLATTIGLSGALLVGASLRFLGFLLFLVDRKKGDRRDTDR